MKDLNNYIFEKFKISKDIKVNDSDTIKKKLSDYGVDPTSPVGKVFFKWCLNHNISNFNIYSHFDFINTLLGGKSKYICDTKKVNEVADKLYDDVHKYNKGKWYNLGDKLCYETDDMIGVGSIENNKLRYAIILK